MADPEAVGKAFLEHYYGLFSNNRAALGTLYQDQSMLTFEGQKFQGQQAIVGKLTALPFQTVKVQPTSMDFQPSVSGGALIFVTGQILVRPIWRPARPPGAGSGDLGRPGAPRGAHAAAPMWHGCARPHAPPRPARGRGSNRSPPPPPALQPEGESNALKFSQVRRMCRLGRQRTQARGWVAQHGRAPRPRLPRVRVPAGVPPRAHGRQLHRQQR